MSRLLLLIVLMLSVVMSPMLLPALAQDKPLVDKSSTPLRLAVPKLDSRLDLNTEKPKSSTPQLKGSIERREKTTPLKALHGFKRGTLDNNQLQSRLNNNALNSELSSGFGIIGVRFLLSYGRPPIINRIFPGTPADKTGLCINDVIVAVDGVPTYGLSKEEIYDLITGSPGTPVTVSIMRNGDYQVINCVRMDVNDITDPLVRRDYLLSM